MVLLVPPVVFRLLPLPSTPGAPLRLRPLLLLQPSAGWLLLRNLLRKGWIAPCHQLQLADTPLGLQRGESCGRETRRSRAVQGLRRTRRDGGRGERKACREQGVACTEKSCHTMQLVMQPICQT